MLPVIILILSLFFLYGGISGILLLFIKVISFWGEVNWKNPERISYNFKASGLGLVAFVVGFAGTIWSVIVLANIYLS